MFFGGYLATASYSFKTWYSKYAAVTKPSHYTVHEAIRITVVKLVSPEFVSLY